MSNKPHFQGHFSSSQGDVRKKVYFTVAEKNLIDMLQEDFEITYLEAVDQIIKYKREQVLYYRQQGNHKLADKLLDELGEK